MIYFENWIKVSPRRITDQVQLGIKMNKILVAILVLMLAACQPAPDTETTKAPEAAPETETAEMPEPAPETGAAVDEASTRLYSTRSLMKSRRATNTAIRRKPSSFLALNLA
jgi:hypothetical protein